MHLAAWNGHADVVELLLNRGPSRANVNEQVYSQYLYVSNTDFSIYIFNMTYNKELLDEVFVISEIIEARLIYLPRA